MRGKMRSVADASIRFRMVKAHHTKTLRDALVKGSVDKQLVSLYKKIIKSRDYFTSSGCSGRIMLLGVEEEGKKNKAYFHAKWHRTVKPAEVWGALNKKSTGMLWFKLESLILHIGCAGLEHAQEVLSAMGEAGIKRGGIMVAKSGKYIVEMVGTQEMNVPVKEGNRVIVDKAYLEKLVGNANRKLRRNYATLKKFEKCFAGRLAQTQKKQAKERAKL